MSAHKTSLLRLQRAKRQGGFALLSVLMVVALITMIAAELIYQQHLTLQRSSNMLHQAQSSAVAWGLEAWIKKGLSLDAQAGDIDHLNEEWAQPMLPIPFEGGEISGQLFDQQGLLNVNNLQQSEAEQREQWQAIFERYFALFELQPGLAAVMIDWVDGDNDLTENGAESDYYLLQVPPYRTANQKMVLVDEMGLLKGVDTTLLAQIRPGLSALPEATPINVNTAPIEVLQALAEWMSVDLATRWIAQREADPADEPAEFRAFMVSQGIEEAKVNEALTDTVITTQSNYFLLKGRSAYGDSQLSVGAIFYRKGEQLVNLIQRWVEVAND